MRKTFLAVPVLALAAWCITRPGEVPFEKTLIDGGAAETCAFADVDGDGRLDIVAGEYWYQAPRWKPHRFRDIQFLDNYIDNFCDLPLDVNGDGRVDIVSCLGFENRLVWMENPGKAGGAWKEHLADSGSFIETAFLVDLDNDGKAEEVLPNYLGDRAPVVWFERRNGTLVKHLVSSNAQGHGIGVGDINGDGRNDVITVKGWFEAPADPRSENWAWHPDFDLGVTGLIYALDINGDGRKDILVSQAHNYGIWWFEHTSDGKWVKHVIDESYSQGHAVNLVDLNGDGSPDLLTGKRYMAHNGHDPGEREPLGIYWYEYRRTEKGVQWVRHVIDYSTRTGAGMHIPTASLAGRLSFLAAGKNGLYLFQKGSSK